MKYQLLTVGSATGNGPGSDDGLRFLYDRKRTEGHVHSPRGDRVEFIGFFERYQ